MSFGSEVPSVIIVWVGKSPLAYIKPPSAVMTSMVLYSHLLYGEPGSRPLWPEHLWSCHTIACSACILTYPGDKWWPAMSLHLPHLIVAKQREVHIACRERCSPSVPLGAAVSAVGVWQCDCVLRWFKPFYNCDCQRKAAFLPLHRFISLITIF